MPDAQPVLTSLDDFLQSVEWSSLTQFNIIVGDIEKFWQLTRAYDDYEESLEKESNNG